jgi:hypothetical protein
MRQAQAIFPILSGISVRGQARLQAVNGFCAHEVAHRIGKFRFGQEHTVKACLSFWYRSKARNLPLVAEFSFDYDWRDDISGDAEGSRTAQIPVDPGAHGLFQVLQRQVDWVKLTETTKTACAYKGF